jgi:hypothetical protein
MEVSFTTGTRGYVEEVVAQETILMLEHEMPNLKGMVSFTSLKEPTNGLAV